MLNTFPRWKYGFLLVALLVGLIYALPNIYGEDPAVQIIGLQGTLASTELKTMVQQSLDSEGLKFKTITLENDQLLVRFLNTKTQIAGRDLFKNKLGSSYSVALNLAPATPAWLEKLGATPMKLGLDLRGGVRFVMEVDVASNIKRRLEAISNDLRNSCREARIYYESIVLNDANVINVAFKDVAARELAQAQLTAKFPALSFNSANNPNSLNVALPNAELEQLRNYTLEQTVSTLRNRINELGVAEALIQREGNNKIVVELPGIQDTARAKDILGKTATVDFLLEDSESDLSQVLQGRIPPGSKVFLAPNNRPLLLKNRAILSGDAIVGASSQYDSRDGKPVVAVTLGGSGTTLFKETTLNNVGKHMAVIYRESTLLNGQPVLNERVISYATINSALGNNFEISGLSLQESRDLALLLRSGSLPATISIIEERVIGPSMGQENIDKGLRSVVVGFCLILGFMTVYYSVFGIIANIALFFNLILLLALMSLIGATLTLPGIAGIVLTLGMAVDANVLIFERIREELRNKCAPRLSIQRGFEHAFATILDSNLTTLIVGVILYMIGTGPVKGFAVTLSLGILTSLLTAVTATRALVELVYGKPQVKRLAVGI